MKKILLMSVLLFSLMLIVVPVGYAGNPPPPPPGGEKFVGPAIVGTITIQPGGIYGGFTATFSGHCRGIPIAGGGDFGGSFGDLTPEYLEGKVLGEVGTTQIPLDCAPAQGGYGTQAVIFNVTQFTKIGTVITAQVVALFLVPK